MKRSVVWTAALLASAFLTAGCDSTPGSNATVGNVGSPEPFTLNNLAGESRSYEEYAEKETLLLCFFETTQKPSVDQIDTIQEVFTAHEGKVAVAAVALDDDAAAVQGYADERTLDFDVLIGSRDQLRSVAEDYGGANYLPTTLVVHKGRIIKRFIGYADKRTINDVLPPPPTRKKKPRKEKENAPEELENAEEKPADEPKTEPKNKNARKNRKAGGKKQGQSNK